MSGAAGPRTVDISIQSRVDTGTVTPSDSEVLKTITIQGLLPFSWETDITYFHPVDSPAPWLDLSRIDVERHRVEAEALMAVRLKLESPWGLSIQSIHLVEKVCVDYPHSCQCLSMTGLSKE
jgi:hypothetical protein